MSKLKTYKFSKLYEMSSGISSKPEQAGHGSPFVSFSTVFKDHFLPESLDELMDTSEKEKETYSVKQGDIFLTRTSETLDELGMSSVAVKDYPDASYSGFLKRLRPTQDDLTYHKYMAFYLRSKLFRKTMNNNAIMTLRASLNEQIFSYLDLILPEKSEQIKIGDLLYKINQKIELNNKINAELESMAKLFYDYWFVQFDFPDENGKPYKSSGGKMVWNETLKRDIPAGWTNGIASNLFDFNPNTILPKNTLSDYIDMNALPTKGYMCGFRRKRTALPGINGHLLEPGKSSKILL
jgi:type I restriction enzyme, S subunit